MGDVDNGQIGPKASDLHRGIQLRTGRNNSRLSAVDLNTSII
ncbi:unnamed protein product [Timema podura]|uniref:Uncharacterized protein n=1 Tax=Timema podura TaxID=61482 RepID=A0ABN7PGJ1_TIMPD|nr:unnamed protein product [Timema podura]